MHLRQFLKEAEITQRKLCKKLDPQPTQGLVSQWVRGITPISLMHAIQIKKLSKGKVSYEEMSDMYVGKKSKHAPKHQQQEPTETLD